MINRLILFEGGESAPLQAQEGTYKTYDAEGLREHLEPDHNPHALPPRVIEKAMQQANELLEDS